jgi:hypothetical protein
MIQQNTSSSLSRLTTSLLAGLIGLTTIGCTSPTASSIQGSPQPKSQAPIAPTVGKSSEKELIAQSAPVTRNNSDTIAESVPIGNQIENGDYGIGNTDLGLEVDGKRFRVYSQPGKEPWQDSANLKYVKKGVVFDGKNHWCLTSMTPQGKMPACTPDGWKVSKAYVAPTPAPEHAAASSRPETQMEITEYPEMTEGMSYRTFQQSAAEKGWQPNRSNNCKANINEGSTLCEQLPELQSCDQNSCQVVFNRVQTGKLITLKVFGGNNDQNALGRDSKWRVISWSIDADNSQP